MTQQQQFYPQQGYPAQAPQPVYPQQGYPAQQQPQPYAPQFPGYPGQMAPAYAPPVQQVPQAPVIPGTIADFYSQPSTGGGPSISWKNKPEGTFIVGTITRAPEVAQDSDPKTGQLKTFRDGRPKFYMKLGLQVAPSPEHPEGEGSLYVRGQMRDELVRAMAEAGVPQGTEPAAGDTLQVTLVQRKPTQSGIPQNIFAIRYARGTGAPSPAPVPQAQQPAAAQFQQPVQQFQPPAAPQAPAYAQQMPQAPQPMAQPVQQQAPWPAEQPAAYSPGPAQQVQQPAPAPQFQAPAAQPQAAQQPAVPDGLSADQAMLLARLTGTQG